MACFLMKGFSVSGEGEIGSIKALMMKGKGEVETAAARVGDISTLRAKLVSALELGRIGLENVAEGIGAGRSEFEDARGLHGKADEHTQTASSIFDQVGINESRNPEALRASIELNALVGASEEVKRKVIIDLNYVQSLQDRATTLAEEYRLAQEVILEAGAEAANEYQAHATSVTSAIDEYLNRNL